MSDRLDRFARRVEDDQFFLASVLAEYARSEDLDDGGLAGELGCPVAVLTPLRLCRRPRPDPVGMREDTGQIAERFGVDVTILAEMVRRADALATLRQSAPAAQGTVIAARDREQGSNGAGSTEDGR